MYFELENKFEKNSIARKTNKALLLILGFFLILLLIVICIFQVELKILVDFLLVLAYSVLSCTSFYLYLFFNSHRKGQKNIKSFFRINETKKLYLKLLHDEDIKLLKDILLEHNINTRPKLSEVIRHYQCLLPRNNESQFTVIPVLALVVSLLALLFNPEVLSSVANVNIIVFVIFSVIFLYGFLYLPLIQVFRVFGKYALYERIEESLSEIYMNYYSKK